jgi:hypothetical protein
MASRPFICQSLRCYIDCQSCHLEVDSYIEIIWGHLGSSALIHTPTEFIACFLFIDPSAKSPSHSPETCLSILYTAEAGEKQVRNRSGQRVNARPPKMT